MKRKHLKCCESKFYRQLQIDVAEIPKIAKITEKTQEVSKENERQRRLSTCFKSIIRQI